MISPILKALNEIFERHKDNFQGALPTYIPELAKANPSDFGICIATVDGMFYEVGCTQKQFSMQSISKIFTYGLALSDQGEEEVLKRVGVEPSGDAFNSIVFDEKSCRPFNPMVNAGAIATTALIKGDNLNERLQRILQMFGRFAGHELKIDQKIYLSEKLTGHRNRAIAYLELNSKMIEEPIEDHLNLYFLQCSVLVNSRDLAIMGATLANNGINPITGVQAERPEHIRHILSIMQSCGMYNFSGEWTFRVGLPAKSGVSGGIMAVVPGYLGIGIYSPLLDSRGNSERGIHVCEDLSKNFDLHLFVSHPPLRSVIRRNYSGIEVLSKRRRNAWELEILTKVGYLIQVYELQGDLFFSSVEQLCRQFLRPAEGLFVIIDGTHVGRVDQSVPQILNTLRQMLIAKNIKLLIAGKNSSLYSVLQNEEAWPKSCFFDSIEVALENCEDSLLEMNQKILIAKIPLKEIDVLKNFTKEELKIIENNIKEINYASGDLIIKEQEIGDELFMLASGLAGIYLLINTENQRYRRVGAISPGITFGEMSSFYLQKRTANVIAEQPCSCYVLSMAKISMLAERQPKIYAKLLTNIARGLAERLKRANEEIRALSS